MNHCVPDFDYEDEDAFPSFSAPLRRKIQPAPEEDLLELLWRKGPVVQPMQSDRSRRRSPELFAADFSLPGAMDPCVGGGMESAAPATAMANELFMEEDEMASWLHYPTGEEEAYRELLHSSPDAGQIPANRPAELDFPAASAGKVKQGVVVTRESTVADSNETPVVAAERMTTPWSRVSAVSGEPRTCEQVTTSSSWASGERAARSERKRKGREGDESECQSEDGEYESGDKRKEACRSASARRTRAAEVHNLSERRRRDRINEKMKALQELIPRCNKLDKASMLDDAIEYLKSLQLQVQMMSMGCHMGSLMFPGIQTYMPPMAMGMGMGIGMGMGMGSMGTEMGAGGLGRPMVPFGSVLPGPHMAGPSTTHLGPMPFMPPFHSPNMALADQFRIQAFNQTAPTLNSVCMRGSNTCPNTLQIPNIADPDRRYVGVHNLRVPSQTQALAEQGTDKGTDITEKSKFG